jgi:hypothetical protein
MARLECCERSIAEHRTTACLYTRNTTSREIRVSFAMFQIKWSINVPVPSVSWQTPTVACPRKPSASITQESTDESHRCMSSTVEYIEPPPVSIGMYIGGAGCRWPVPAPRPSESGPVPPS